MSFDTVEVRSSSLLETPISFQQVNKTPPIDLGTAFSKRSGSPFA
jgi:hypothetical protein